MLKDIALIVVILQAATLTAVAILSALKATHLLRRRILAFSAVSNVLQEKASQGDPMAELLLLTLDPKPSAEVQERISAIIRDLNGIVATPATPAPTEGGRQ